MCLRYDLERRKSLDIPQHLFEGNMIRGYKVYKVDVANKKYVMIGKSHPPKNGSINPTDAYILRYID